MHLYGYQSCGTKFLRIGNFFWYFVATNFSDCQKLIFLLVLTCWLFVKKSTPLVTALSKWERDLSSNDIHWKNYFKQIKFMCKENKLKEFYFKLVHRILVSKKELHLFGVSNNSNCNSISHTFIECHLSKKFFQNVLQHFNKENATSFTQFLNTIAQLQRSPLLKKLNYCMLLAKYYLYNQKINQIEPELNKFNNRLNLKYCIEKLI